MLPKGATDPYAGFFTSDRAAKYGWGLPRLLLVTWLSFEVAPWFSNVIVGTDGTGDAARALGLSAYLSSQRWLPHFYVGCQGAVVNVEVRMCGPIEKIPPNPTKNLPKVL